MADNGDVVLSHWTEAMIREVPHFFRGGEQIEDNGRRYLVSALVWREDGSCDLHLVPVT